MLLLELLLLGELLLLRERRLLGELVLAELLRVLLLGAHLGRLLLLWAIVSLDSEGLLVERACRRHLRLRLQLRLGRRCSNRLRSGRRNRSRSCCGRARLAARLLVGLDNKTGLTCGVLDDSLLAVRVHVAVRTFDCAII